MEVCKHFTCSKTFCLRHRLKLQWISLFCWLYLWAFYPSPVLLFSSHLQLSLTWSTKSYNIPCMRAQSLSRGWLFATHQAPLSMGFLRQEYWSGLPFPTPQYSLKFSFSLDSEASCVLQKLWWPLLLNFLTSGAGKFFHFFFIGSIL